MHETMNLKCNSHSHEMILAMSTCSLCHIISTHEPSTNPHSRSPQYSTAITETTTPKLIKCPMNTLFFQNNDGEFFNLYPTSMRI